MADWSASDANIIINEFAEIASKVYDAKSKQFIRTSAAVVKSISGGTVTVYPLSGEDTEAQRMTLKNSYNINLNVGDIVWVDYWGDLTNAYLSPANRQMYGQNSIMYKGSVYMTTTNESPGSELGGTWVLMDKEFTPTYNTNMSSGQAVEGITINSTNTTSFELYVKRAGHMITLQCNYETEVAIGDTLITVGKFNFAQLGINASSFDYTQRIAGVSDDGAATVYMYLDNYGTLTTRDVVGKSGATTVAAGSSIGFNASCILHPDMMLDSFCNKFFWRRTA